MTVPGTADETIRCTVARDVAKELRDSASRCEDLADGDVSGEARAEYRTEARVLRSVARVIERVNRKR